MKIGDTVEIEWIDAQTLDGFISYEEAMNTEQVISKTCGYFVGQDKHKIVISFINFGQGTTKYFQLIPKGMVKKIKVLK